MANLRKKEQEGNVAVAERTRNAATYTPRFDIVERENELLLYGDLPGVTEEGLDIRFDNGELIIEGKVEPRHTGHKFLYGEYGIGDFYRSFSISEAIDVEKIAAELHHGVLVLHLPKTEAVKPRKIAVKAAS